MFNRRDVPGTSEKRLARQWQESRHRRGFGSQKREVASAVLPHTFHDVVEDAWKTRNALGAGTHPSQAPNELPVIASQLPNHGLVSGGAVMVQKMSQEWTTNDRLPSSMLCWYSMVISMSAIGRYRSLSVVRSSDKRLLSGLT
jgi:hypothetical protein